MAGRHNTFDQTQSERTPPSTLIGAQPCTEPLPSRRPSERSAADLSTGGGRQSHKHRKRRKHHKKARRKFINAADQRVELDDARVDAMIAAHLRADATNDYPYTHCVEYASNEIDAVLRRAKRVLVAQPMLAHVTPPAVVFGDMHGQFDDLRRWFHVMGLPMYTNKKYVFMGDFVDRGPASVETIVFLLLLAIKCPTQMFLLRGNHETEDINGAYGFKEELEKRCKLAGLGELLWKQFNATFAQMPIAALVGGRILCMHGGISPKLSSLYDILCINKGFMKPEAGTLAQDLLWTDPDPNGKGFHPNEQRNVSMSFGQDTLRPLCQRLGIDLVARGHQVVVDGYEFFADKRLVTLFSAPLYDSARVQYNNGGGAMLVRDDLSVEFVWLLSTTENEKIKKHK